MNAILGEKLGMTQIFDDQSRAIPVTVIKAGPCHVVQIKRIDTTVLASDSSGIKRSGHRADQGHSQSGGQPTATWSDQGRRLERYKVGRRQDRTSYPGRSGE